MATNCESGMENGEKKEKTNNRKYRKKLIKYEVL